MVYSVVQYAKCTCDRLLQNLSASIHDMVSFHYNSGLFE